MHLIDKSKHLLIDDAILDARATHKNSDYGYFFICKRFPFPQWSPNDPDEPINFIQNHFSIKRLDQTIVETIEYEYEHGFPNDCWISQHTYCQPHRRSSNSLRTFSAGFVDLDCYKSTKLIGLSRQHVVYLVLKALDAHKIPLPSYIVDSGRGLQVKWSFSHEITKHAYIKLQATLKHLISDCLFEFEADPAANLPSQLLRVIGTKNQKGGMVEIIWKNIHNGMLQNYSFDDFAKSVLPYTQEETKEFKDKLKKACRVTKMQNLNRAKASALHLSKQKVNSSANSAESSSVEGIWARRLDLMEQRIEKMGWLTTGIPDGSKRYAILFLAATALCWMNNQDESKSKKAACEWSSDFIKTYPMYKTVEVVSSVLKRIETKALYKYTEAKFLQKLDELMPVTTLITSTEVGYKNPLKVNVGAMNLEKIRGLSTQKFKKVVLERRSSSALRTNAIRIEKSAAKRQLAFELSVKGVSQNKIAREIGVSQGTISKWFKKGNPLI